MKYKLRGRVWQYAGPSDGGGWHFVSVNKKISKEIKEDFGGVTGGFGSLPVKVIVGKTEWQTSIFPDKKSGTYLLPLKAKVRMAEGIVDEKMLSFMIELLV